MQWKIYYPKTTYSSDDALPENAPKCGVQAVADILIGRRIWNKVSNDSDLLPRSATSNTEREP